jgi:hypothetical protein
VLKVTQIDPLLNHQSFSYGVFFGSAHDNSLRSKPDDGKPTLKEMNVALKAACLAQTRSRNGNFRGFIATLTNSSKAI